MKYIFSKIEQNTLLHLINLLSDVNNRTNVCPSEEFLQLATLQMQKGQTFKAHKHIYKNGPPNIIAQESWVVIRGSVKVFFYDLDDTLVEEHILYPGDCSVTFRGGHNYEILENDTIVYEYKTGPYHGIEMDKTFI